MLLYIIYNFYRPYGKNVPYEEYWSAYEKIMMEAGGRPHWAKVTPTSTKTHLFGIICMLILAMAL